MLYAVISIALIVVSLLLTIAVGVSPANREENNQYTLWIGKGMWLQTVFYVVGTVLFVAILMIYAV